MAPSLMYEQAKTPENMKNIFRHRLIAIAAIMLTLADNACAQSTWTKQTAPVMTVWGEQLTADNVWKEYPRPSMKRQDWMNLNGIWQYY